jgi:zinc D-Ala-D-Ala carboxypeptidase
MIVTYSKGIPRSIGSKHFSSIHFDCKGLGCCIFTKVHYSLGKYADELWDLIGPFQINSGYRCALHNASEQGAAHSEHLITLAFDAKSLVGLSGKEIAKAAEKIPAFASGGIGIYPSFCHLDIRGYPSRWGTLTKC